MSNLDKNYYKAMAAAETNLYQEIVKRGIPHASHESDLYIPFTNENWALAQKYSAARPTTFMSNVDQKLWIDIPFAFQPFWDRKAKVK